MLCTLSKRGRARNQGANLSEQVLGKAAAVIDFIVVHTYPLWDVDFYDFADGKVDFQVLASSWNSLFVLWLLCICMLLHASQAHCRCGMARRVVVTNTFTLWVMNICVRA